MGTKRTFRFNVIFTGKFLYVWYLLFALIMVLMLVNWGRLKAVDEYKLTIFDSSGQPVETRTVTKSEVSIELNFLPVMKSFEPLK